QRAAASCTETRAREVTQDGTAAAASMAPRMGWPRYGSVEDLANARAVSQPMPIVASNAPPSRTRQEGLEVDPLYATVTEKAPRQWVRLAVVCGLAVGAVAGVVRSGYSSSPTTSTASSAARSFVEVSG
ncbi:unnamed protein product, partial [Laminaria digitata]